MNKTKSQRRHDALVKRITDEACYIALHEATIRETALHFGVSKSTVQNDVSNRLPKLAPRLSLRVQCVLNKHIQDRHIKGGRATAEKYRKQS